MKAELEAEDAMERLQRRLVKGTLVAQSGEQRARSDEILPVKRSAIVSSSRTYTTPIGDAPTAGHRSVAPQEAPTSSAASSSGAAGVAPVRPPHERMVEYIFNAKEVHQQKVEVYKEYMQRVKRGMALKAAASAEDKRTMELGDIAFDLKMRVMDQLATAQRILERTDAFSSAALANLYANIGGTAVPSDPQQQDADDGGLPLHLMRFIGQAKARRCAAARKGPHRAGPSASLSLTGGVQDIQEPRSIEEEALALELQDSAYIAPCAHMTTAEARSSWFESVANASSNDALSSVTLLDAACCDDALHDRLDTMAIEAGLMQPMQKGSAHPRDAMPRQRSIVWGSDPMPLMQEQVSMPAAQEDRRPLEQAAATIASDPLQASPSGSRSPLAPDAAHRPPEDTRRVTTIATAAPPLSLSPQSVLAPLGNGMSDNVVQHELSIASPSVAGATSSSRHAPASPQKHVLSTAGDEAPSAIPLPVPLEAALFASGRDTAAMSFSAAGRRSSLPSTTTKWTCSSCSCESTFHSIKAKMFEDIKRSMRARYVSTFLSQLESISDEVVEWKSGVVDEMQRLGDVLTTLLHERESAEKEAVKVSLALQQLRQAIGGVVPPLPSFPSPVDAPPQVSPDCIQTITPRTFTDDSGVASERLGSGTGLEQLAAAHVPGPSPLSIPTPTTHHHPHHTPDNNVVSQASGSVGSANVGLLALRTEQTVHTTPAGGGDDHAFAAGASDAFDGLSPLVPAASTAGVPLQRVKSVVGTIQVDWHRFLDEHSPIGASLRRLTATNAALEGSIMRAHDHFQPPVELTVTEGSDAFSIASATPAQSPRTIGKLRLISTRVGDASTQTLSEEDYFLDNIESVMTAGTSLQPELARLAQSVQYASSSFGSFKPSQPAGRSSVASALDAASVATTQRMQQLLLKHLQLPAPILSLTHRPSTDNDDRSDDDDDDQRTLGTTSVSSSATPLFLRQFAEQLVDITAGVKRFCSELIDARPKPLPAHMHSVSVADVNANTEAFDEALVLKVRQVASRLGEALTVCATASQGATAVVERLATVQSQANAMQGQLKAADEALLVAKRARKILEESNAALEAKLAKATAAAQAAATKKDKASSPAAAKEAQLAKSNRLLDESRQRLQGLMDAVKATLLQCCSNGSNARLAIALEEAWADNNDVDAKGRSNSDPAATALLNALQHLSSTGGMLSSVACPDPLFLRLNHETSKSAALVLDVLRMNHIDVPLDMMESIGRAVRAFGAPNDDETEAEYVVRRAAAARNGEPPPQPAYLSLCDVPASDLAGSISLQLTHIAMMMQGARKQLPVQRKQIIKPFVLAARRMVSDAREDLRANALAVEWYLKKREAAKHLLEGEEAVVTRGHDGSSSSSASDQEAEQDDAVPVEATAADGPAAGKSTGDPSLQSETLVSELSLRKSSSHTTKKRRKRKPAPLDDDDSPLQALLKTMSAYRTDSERVLEMLTDKKVSIASEQQLGLALQTFAQEQQAPVSLRVRRSLKDVTARMIAVIEGKRIADAICRDACEGTAENIVVETAVQAVPDVAFADGVTEYLVEDYEPYEGDAATIREAFNDFEQRVVQQTLVDPALKGIGEDYIGVLGPVDAAAPSPAGGSASCAATHPQNESADDAPRSTPNIAVTDPTAGADGSIAMADDPAHTGNASNPSATVTPRIPTFSPLHERQNAARRTSPPAAPSASVTPSPAYATAPRPRMPTASTYAQTSVDMDCMSSLYSRLPLSQLFLFGPLLRDAVDVLEDCNPVDPAIPAMRDDLDQMVGLFTYRRAQRYTELGHQMLKFLEVLMDRVVNELRDKVRFARIQSTVFLKPVPSGADGSPTAAVATQSAPLKRPPQAPRRGNEVALQVAVTSVHAAVQASGNSGGRGFQDSLEEEELARVSFLPLFVQFKGHLETLRAIKEQNKLSALHKSLDAVAGHPATPIAPPAALESLRVDAIVHTPLDEGSPVTLGRQQSRRLSRGSAAAADMLGASLTSSFRHTPHCTDLPPSGMPTPALEGLDTATSTTVAPPPPSHQSLPLAASALLKLEDSIVVPLRRAMFRCMNEPPFTLPPAPGTAHPPQKFTAASLRCEIAGLQTILGCLQRHAELTGSYRQTLMRLVGMRIQKRRWQRLYPQAEAEGLALIEAHSKVYKFLTAKPPTMNARRRREEQARILQERSDQFKAVLAAKLEQLQREVVRLEKITSNLNRQREEHILLFLKDYYCAATTTSSTTTKAAVVPPPLPAATVLPTDLRLTMLHDAAPTLAGLIAMLWGGGGNSWSSMQQHYDDDPKSKSWFDRTGTSQGGGGNRGVRFDDMHHVRVGTTDHARGDLFPQPDEQALLRQQLIVSADDLDRLKRQDYFSWSTSTAGIKTLLSSHNLFTTRKRAPVVGGLHDVAATAASIPSASTKLAQGSSGLLPLCRMEDEACGGVAVKGWGGLVHLDTQQDHVADTLEVERATLSPEKESADGAVSPRSTVERSGVSNDGVVGANGSAGALDTSQRAVHTPPQLQSQNPQTKSLRAMIMINRGGPVARPGHTHLPHQAAGGTGGGTLQRLAHRGGAHTLPVTAPVIEGDVQGTFLMGVGSPTHTSASPSQPIQTTSSNTAQRYSPPPALGSGAGVAVPVHRKPGAGIVLAPLDGPSKVTRR